MRKVKGKKVQKLGKASFDFSKVYFSKPVSVVMVSAYASILLLVVATLGVSAILKLVNSDRSVPKLPEPETYAFQPADNETVEIPVLGDSTEEKVSEKTSEETPAKQTEQTEQKSEPASTQAPTTRVYVPVYVATPAETPVKPSEPEAAPKEQTYIENENTYAENLAPPTLNPIDVITDKNDDLPEIEAPEEEAPKEPESEEESE